MINTGVRFNNLWSNPTCTPTRSSIITGKYGFRTDVTDVGDILSVNETSLQKYINDTLISGYSNAVFRKWHLSEDLNHPNQIGVDTYAGFISGTLVSY